MTGEYRKKRECRQKMYSASSIIRSLYYPVLDYPVVFVGFSKIFFLLFLSAEGKFGLQHVSGIGILRQKCRKSIFRGVKPRAPGKRKAAK